ncbi:MAG: hypothetical protein M1837_007015 [Sclerophora amabilis]|nr:MAG: hypothetical protein M1837_007015 [Sclerophora amabilis]
MGSTGLHIDPLSDSRPEVLQINWKLNQEDVIRAINEGQLNDWNICSLSERQVQWQLSEHERLLKEQELSFKAYERIAGHEDTGTGSLASIVTATMLNLLERSDNVLADVRLAAKILNFPAVRDIVRNPRTSYLVLRAFMMLPPGHGPGDPSETARAAIDLDEAVMANERYLRSRGHERNKDGTGLVTLDDAELLFGKRPDPSSGRALTITRKDPPKGGFQVLDNRRIRKLFIQPTTEAFITTFNRITHDVLNRMNWDHVLVAGGMILTTLLHTDPSKDNEKSVSDCDIDLYIYGLTATEANDKVSEIFDVWRSNLPPTNQQRLVVKNSKTIVFLSDYPNRRVQIVLKLAPSPTSVLLNFDLDACAIGFDGKNVLMLPRCARALETGYSTFTCDLIWGHHLGDRRATQDERVFKYADRGFGIRILPSYIRSLEIPIDEGPEQIAPCHDPELVFPESEYGKYTLFPRKPSGAERGLKTLKRICLLARDMVQRFYFGVTELSRPNDRWDYFWDNLLAEAKEIDEEQKERNGQLRAQGMPVEVPLIRLSDLDGSVMHQSLPRRRGALGCFELWMRHCEAWRLDAAGEAVLDRTSVSSTMYDLDTYDDLPGYRWDEDFKTDDFIREIENHHHELFYRQRSIICSRLNIGLRQSGWRDYFTRRLRRIVYGPDIQAVFEKQITLPVIIPYDLEQTFESMISEPLRNDAESQERLLIPIHRHGEGIAIIPDLPEQTGMVCNVRYWVIGNELMWAGIDRKIDEIFEVLWTFFHWQNATALALDAELFDPASLPFFAIRYRDRLTSTFDLPCTDMVTKPGTLSERESTLFRSWALQRPVKTERDYEHDFYEVLNMSQLFRDTVKYPPPEEMFWNPEDDLEEDPGVAQWVDVVDDGDDDDDHGLDDGSTTDPAAATKTWWGTRASRNARRLQT